MKYQFSMPVFMHDMAVRPSSTVTGEVELAVRPMIGEQVLVDFDGKWHKIEAIRHSADGLELVLERAIKPN